MSRTVYGHISCRIKFAITSATRAELEEEVAIRIKDLDSVVTLVGNVNFIQTIKGNSLRSEELTIANF